MEFKTTRLDDIATGRNVDKEEDEGLSSVACPHSQAGEKKNQQRSLGTSKELEVTDIGRIMPKCQINEN